MDYRLKLRNLRIDSDLKQCDIAEICNVSAKEVSHWETLKRGMDASYVIQLCKFYGVTIDYIYGLDEK